MYCIWSEQRIGSCTEEYTWVTIGMNLPRRNLNKSNSNFQLLQYQAKKTKTRKLHDVLHLE
jgi:hypothetical protein